LPIIFESSLADAPVRVTIAGSDSDSVFDEFRDSVYGFLVILNLDVIEAWPTGLILSHSNQVNKVCAMP
jgi:hypothetical protein